MVILVLRGIFHFKGTVHPIKLEFFHELLTLVLFRTRKTFVQLLNTNEDIKYSM